MKGVKSTGIQATSPETQVTKKIGDKTLTINRGTNFQAALNQAKGRQLEEKKKESTASAPAPSPSPTSSSNAPSSVGGFASSEASAGTLRGKMGAGAPSGGGFRDDSSQRVEQELNNQLIQSGLQAQVLKSNSTSGQDNS